MSGQYVPEEHLYAVVDGRGVTSAVLVRSSETLVAASAGMEGLTDVPHWQGVEFVFDVTVEGFLVDVTKLGLGYSTIEKLPDPMGYTEVASVTQHEKLYEVPVEFVADLSDGSGARRREGMRKVIEHAKARAANEWFESEVARVGHERRPEQRGVGEEQDDPKGDAADVLRAYDAYIKTAFDAKLPETGWSPVCVDEFVECEYPNVWVGHESGSDPFEYMYDGMEGR